jgi:colanic acid biosynthesis glycosyl transferase WcaI
VTYLASADEVNPVAKTPMRRIIFVNRYFAPDYSATSQILSDLAFHLARGGREVHVIAGNQLYDDPHATLPAHEKLSGVHVHRVASTRFGRSGLFRRGMDYLALYAALRGAALRVACPGDILVAKTDPPLLSIVMANVARRRDAHLVNWLQDLYPEIAIQLGVPFLNGFIARRLAAARDKSLHAASANVVLGDLMADQVRRRGVAPTRIKVIHNWSDERQITPVARSGNPLRQQWNLQGKFVLGYSGNLGRAHEFETILNAAERLRRRPDIMFLFVGGGGRSGELKRIVNERGLAGQFQFRPYQDRSNLKFSLGLPDVHWISLRPQVEGLIVPSKVYGVLAAGRAIIAITAAGGEVARIVEQAGCGVTVEPGDPGALVDAILRFADSPARCEKFGDQARKAAEERFSRAQAFRHWERLLDEIPEECTIDSRA